MKYADQVLCNGVLNISPPYFYAQFIILLMY